MGNDERQFNAPGLRIPMLALTRQLPPSHPEHPYREYHSSEDTPDRVPPGAMEASRDLVLSIIDVLERNAMVTNRFSGEVFCSRYGIHFDPFTEREAHKALFDVLFLVDGHRSLAEIAEDTGAPFSAVRRIVDALARHDLIVLGEVPAHRFRGEGQ
jgi:aminopeptidase-like protein